MRIRKRKVPLPLSSLSPVPLSSLSLSDPHTLSASSGSLLPPVQLLLRPTAADGIDKNSKLSDQAATNRPPIGSPDTIDRSESMISGEEKLVRNDFSCSAPSKIGGSAQVHQLSTLHQGGRWREGEKSSFPLKKRSSQDEDGEEEGGGGAGEGEEVKNVGIVSTPNSKGVPSPSGSVKKRGRGAGGGTVMEGSRCSRVNGRGWRCCQPTLVGYSLCEHHLGKGRLRSMTNVRNRQQTKQTTPPLSVSSRAVLKQLKDEEDGDYVGERKTSKKGTKLGVVKARSMSSLLGQADNDGNCSGATPAAATVEAVGSDHVKESSADE